MCAYQTPTDHYEFILHELLTVQDKLDGYDAETTRFMMNTASSFAEKELAPLYEQQLAVEFTPNTEGEFGTVTLPEGYQQAYSTFCEAGLQGIVADPTYGEAAIGQPHAVGAVVDEILHSANGDFSLIPTLTHSAYLGIYTHGTDEQKHRYLPDLASGKSSGIMCMTEPSAGSDLSNVRTTATPSGDGSYALNGQKIYISGGENHFTREQDDGNIIHVVLAKVKEPSGKIDDRVSMFIVPKIRTAKDGTRSRNSTGAIGVEHKMGMAGSATCTMLYQDAWGEMIGQRGKGIATMFAVMNEARNHVARQALGCAEAAFQKTWFYATDEQSGRRMGRAIGGAKDPQKEADLICEHPAVRKLLLRMRSLISGARMLQLDTALQMDLAKQGDENAAAWVSLMTNIVKAHVTDIGSLVTDDAIQVYGGMGYIEETGVARHYRDVRVTRIYEGTNQIQAVSLLRQMKHLPILVSWLKETCKSDSAYAASLEEGLLSLQKASEYLLKDEDATIFAGGADELLSLMGTVALGGYHARAALTASRAKPHTPLHAKIQADARYYFAHILPNHTALAARAMANAKSLELA